MNRQDESRIDTGLLFSTYLNRELNLNFSEIFPHMGSNDTGL